jgi:hypothetical protein
MTPNQVTEFILNLPSDITVTLWGQPGIGKTDIINEIAKRLDANLITVLASQSEPVDIQGLPNVSPCGNYFDYIPPRWGAIASGSFVPEEYKDKPLILFFDDVVNGEDQTLAALYKVVFENKARGGFTEWVRVMMAGNREEDECNVRPMPTALSNRDLDIYVEPSVDDWLEWSFKNDVHPLCRGFIKHFPQSLNTFKEALETQETKSYATPRSWEIFSKAFKALEASGAGDDNTVRLAAQGTLGISVASTFHGFLRCRQDLVSPEEIVKLKTEDDPCRVPGAIDALHAVVSSYEAYCKTAMSDTRVEPKDKFQNLRAGMIYALRLPPEFGVLFAKVIYQLAVDYKKNLAGHYFSFMDDDIVNRWMEQFSKFDAE